MRSTLTIIEEKMFCTEYSKLQYLSYKDATSKLIKLMDLIDLFATVNS